MFHFAQLKQVADAAHFTRSKVEETPKQQHRLCFASLVALAVTYNTFSRGTAEVFTRGPTRWWHWKGANKLNYFVLFYSRASLQATNEIKLLPGLSGSTTPLTLHNRPRRRWSHYKCNLLCAGEMQLNTVKLKSTAAKERTLSRGRDEKCGCMQIRWFRFIFHYK